MRTPFIISLLFAALALSTPQITQAQGTTYVSNLGQASTGSAAVGSDSWWAEGFYTGNNSSGYMLNSIQLQMKAASGSSSDLSVFIYNNHTNDIYPGSSLDALSGSLNPATAGTYTYTASDLTLAPNMLYFIVLTAATPTATGVFNWSYANSTGQSSGGWQFDTYLYFDSSDGLNWGYGRSEYFQLAINATAVPEPSSLMLLGLGGLMFLGLARRKAKVVL